VLSPEPKVISNKSSDELTPLLFAFEYSNNASNFSFDNCFFIFSNTLGPTSYPSKTSKSDSVILGTKLRLTNSEKVVYNSSLKSNVCSFSTSLPSVSFDLYLAGIFSLSIGVPSSVVSEPYFSTIIPLATAIFLSFCISEVLESTLSNPLLKAIFSLYKAANKPESKLEPSILKYLSALSKLSPYINGLSLCKVSNLPVKESVYSSFFPLLLRNIPKAVWNTISSNGISPPSIQSL